MTAPAGVPARRKAVAVGALVLATLFWAGNYIVGEHAVRGLDPLSLTFWRWLLAAPVLVLIACLVERPSWRRVLQSWHWLLLLGLLGLAGYNLLLYSALQHTSAFSASVVNAFNPVLILLASSIFLGVRLTRLAVAGVVVALSGALIVLTRGDILLAFADGLGTGELLMLGAIGAWTAYTIVGRLAPEVPPITSTAAQAVLVVIALAPIIALTGGPAIPATAAAAGAVVFIVLLPSVASYVLWNAALPVVSPARAGVFLNLITAYTALFAMMAGEPVNPAQVLGGAIVVMGVVLANTGGARASQDRRAAP